uniref:Retrovirus-related Pol polyprotein from transposon TNT 1-94 n=1 Tax=Tanacetum cinerariifolium TaxID=118510 RepID=A0A6L2MMB3_TANCI|nr:retrovirus-related Pol polyprotein from transposon TNT 1-94 [Tanacetum cinerariifolium]
MEAGGKDCPPMLAPGNHVQWKSRIKRYIDTKPNHEFIQYCLKDPPYKFTWVDKEVLISEGSYVTTTKTYMENYKNVSQDIRDQLNAEAEAVQIILTGIDNDIDSTVDACPNACEMWKAIERSQQTATRNRGKAIVNSPQPMYDEEPSMVVEDDEMSKDKEIDKLIALISLSFKKIYKPTNNNLRTSSNTSRANQDNSIRINRGDGYDNQRLGNVVGARETVGTMVVQKSRIQCYNYMEFRHVTRECQKPKRAKDAAYHREKMLLYQELEAHYMYMAQIQEVSPDAANSGPIFDSEPVQKIDLNDDDDDDLANECELLASLIEKLKCEIDDSKNRNKFLETSNKVLVEKLKDLKAQLQDKGIAISELKKLIEKLKGKSVDTKFEKSSVIRQPNAFKSQRPSILGKPTIFLDSLERKDCSKSNLNAKTTNVNFVCVTCGKCVLNDKHDMCVLHCLNDVSSWTKMPMVVPVSTREPKRILNQSFAKPLRRIIASESTNQKLRHTTRKLYEYVSKACSWWYPKFTPPGYKWKPNCQIGNVNLNVSMPLGNASRTANILEPITPRRSNVLNTTLYSNSFAARRDNPIHRRLWMLKAQDGKSQAPNQFYGEMSGEMIYSQVLVAQTCIPSLFNKSSPNLICLMAKATSSQAWLWHIHLSHLNFDTINLLLKNDIVIGLPKLKFIKDHLCSSCELGKAKRKSFQIKTTPSSKRWLQLLHMDLYGPMRVESINGRKYVLVIVDDYSRYTWTYFLRSKDETPKVLIDFLRLVQRGLHAQVRTVRTDKGTEFLNKTLHAYFASEGINH